MARPSVASSSDFTVGLRCSSDSVTRDRKGSISWFWAGTAEWAKIVERCGSTPTARASVTRDRTRSRMGPTASRSVMTW